MESIIHPTTTTLQETDTHGSFSVEPLFPGYASTLGNALRRVLLSSLPGAAVDYVVVDGIQHEFSSIEGVREDMIEIILNLKNLRFNMNVDTAELILSKSGAGVVTGADFSANTDCLVVNKDQVIANLNSGAKLEMRIGVKRGQGYEPIEKKIDREKMVGVISIDSLYSPVRAVSYHTENTRVGQMTNFDKLLLDINTDGSILPSEALRIASKILTEQYSAIAGGVNLESNEAAPETEAAHEEIVVTEDSVQILHSLDPKLKIEDAGLSSRTVSALTAAGYKTLSGLKRLSDIKLQSIKGLGSKGVEEVKAVLSRVD